MPKKIIICCLLLTFGLSGCFSNAPDTTPTPQPTPTVEPIINEEEEPTAEPVPTATEAVVEEPTAVPPTITPEPEPTATEEPETVEMPAPVATEHAELRSEMETAVIAIRGLEPLEPIVPTFKSREELRAELEEAFNEESSPEEMYHQAIVLSAYDFMDRDYDLYTALIDLQSEGIAGYYDPETAEFVVVSDDDVFSLSEQWTHAHEFVHALQDQYFPLEQIADESMDSEASAALRAFVEGDATLVQMQFIIQGYFTQEEVGQLFAEEEGQDLSFIDELPPILINSLLFSYDKGLEFVLYIYNGGDLFSPGDFEAVNAVWDNLPQSTEQIIHPERYVAGDTPILVTLPPLTDTLGSGWQQLEESVFGEFSLREYIGQQLPETQVDLAATGWGGDRFAVYWNDEAEEMVMVTRFVWDTEQDAQEFNSTYPNYPTAAFDTTPFVADLNGRCWQAEEDVLCQFPTTNETLLVRAMDMETAVSIATLILTP